MRWILRLIANREVSRLQEIIQNGIRIRKGSFFIPKFKGEKKWHYQ